MNRRGFFGRLAAVVGAATVAPRLEAEWKHREYLSPPSGPVDPERLRLYFSQTCSTASFSAICVGDACSTLATAAKWPITAGNLYDEDE